MSHKIRLAAVLGALALATGCAGQAEPPGVGRFASDNPGSVNTFWLSTPQGLVVVDTQRSLSDARRALAAIKATGQQVAAILVTHAHPDHVGGVGVLHEAFPKAPIHASAATVTFMRTDPLKFYALTRGLPGSDYAPELTFPDQLIAPGAAVTIGDTRVETAQFGPGEADAATVFYEPKTGALFAGDLVSNRATPALLEGHTCGWLTDLDQLRARFPDARTVYPGHGAPGNPTELIDQQRSYLQHVRRLVRTAVGPGSPAGAEVSADEQKSVIDELNRAYPGYPSVASLPTLMEANVQAVAGELRAENPATLPATCRD